MNTLRRKFRKHSENEALKAGRTVPDSLKLIKSRKDSEAEKLNLKKMFYRMERGVIKAEEAAIALQ